MILLQCLAQRRQVLQHLTHSKKQWNNYSILSSTKKFHKKVTFIGSVRNSHHSTQKERFKFSYLDILNSCCNMLLTFPSIHTMKVGSEHQVTLAKCTYLKMCCRKHLWSPLSLSLCTVATSCQASKLLDNGQLGSLNRSNL